MTALDKFEDLVQTAMRGQDQELLGLLLESGVVSQEHLVMAMASGKDEAIRITLDRYPDVRSSPDDGTSTDTDTPLLAAVVLRDESLVRRLLERGTVSNHSQRLVQL